MCVPVNAESLKEMWSNPDRDTYESEKTSLELETCLGEELSEHGIPFVLHGEQYNTVSLYHAYSRSLQLSVRIFDTGSKRLLQVNGRSEESRVGKELVRTSKT